MTVPTELNLVTVVGNGSVGPFNYPYLFYADADLEVVVTVDATGVESEKTLTTHYSVTGAGNVGGGQITMVAGEEIAVGETGTIKRAPARTSSFDPQPGSFDSAAVEKAVDRNVHMAQSLAEILDRSVVAPITDSGLDMGLPSAIDRAGKYFAWDGSGKPTLGASLADMSVSYTTKTFDGDTIETNFDLGAAPASAAATDVFISGVRQVPPTDYTVTGSDLDFISAPPSGTDNIFVVFSQSFAGVPSDGSVTAPKFATLNAANSIIALTALGAASLAEANTFAKTQTWSKGADIASAATLPIGTDGNYFDVTGTNTIGALGGGAPKGTAIKLHFDGALQINHAAAIVLPGGANITTAAGDEAEFVEYDGAGNWRCTNYTRASGKPLVPSLFSGKYTSPEQTITADATLTLTHGLSAKPGIIVPWLVCKTAELGHSVGDEVLLNPAGNDVGSASGTGVSIVPDATDITINYSSTPGVFRIMKKGAGADGLITPANWKFKVVAYV